MYRTAVYTRVNGDVQKVAHLKQQKSWTVILLKQHVGVDTGCSSHITVHDFCCWRCATFRTSPL